MADPAIKGYLDYIRNIFNQTVGQSQVGQSGGPAPFVFNSLLDELQADLTSLPNIAAAHQAATENLNTQAAAYQTAAEKLKAAGTQYQDAATSAMALHSQDAKTILALSNANAAATNPAPVSTTPTGLRGPSLVLALAFFGTLAYYFGPKLFKR